MTEQIGALKWQAKSAKAENGPKVMLKSGYDYRENSHQLHEGVWQAMVMASWNIFDGNVAKNNGLALKAQSQALIEQRQELETLILLQVRQAWLEMQESSDRQHTKTEILETAIPLFADGGYAGVSMRQIAGAVGIKAGSLYYHFPDKETLYIEALTLAFSKHDDFM